MVIIVTNQGTAEGEQIVFQLVCAAVGRDCAGVPEFPGIFREQVRILAFGIRKRRLFDAQMSDESIERVKEFAVRVCC